MWPGVMCFELSGCDGNTHPCFQLSRSAIDSVIGRVRSLLSLRLPGRLWQLRELIVPGSYRRKTVTGNYQIICERLKRVNPRIRNKHH